MSRSKIATNTDRPTYRDNEVRIGPASVYHGDALDHYHKWESPTCIISDGPYGLGKFPGEPATPDRLGEWYAPHVAAWGKSARPDTTLWFWNSELGWATVHPVLALHGWEYEESCVWDKGIAHVAGNCNSKTIRGVPVVTEVAVRYTRRPALTGFDGVSLGIKDWVRSEWVRSGLSMHRANEACGVANAATRKYLTKCHLWYFPPPEAIVRMAAYCQAHGALTSRPYFSVDGQTPPTAAQWERMRSKWHHTHGLTNVWAEPPVHGDERIKSKNETGYLHANQKPLVLMNRQIRASTDQGDTVWEPFGGLFSATVAAVKAGRRAYAAEINSEFFKVGTQRIRQIAPLHFGKLRDAA